jgi:AcrR family transcriptional regulator
MEQRGANPRGSNATKKLLQEVLALGRDIGFSSVTIEGLAERTGIAKTTIYRRWPNVSAIIMDAFLSEINNVAPTKQLATAKESFAFSMKLLARAYRGRLGKLIRPILGQAQFDSSLAEAVKTQWAGPRSQVGREILRKAMERGELRKVDPDVVLDMLYGAIYHRMLVPYSERPLTDAFIDSVVEVVFRGLEP